MNLKKIQNYFITKKKFNVAAIFIIITYKLSENIEELFKGGEFIFSILNTISYSKDFRNYKKELTDTIKIWKNKIHSL